MEKTTLLKTYNENKPLFKRILQNTKEALSQFLLDNKIPFLVISTRIKEFNSFYEKIDRKNYDNPFDENEDFCGVRIIVYHLDDIQRVKGLISKNYNIQNEEDKADDLELNQFGYRSDHLIIKIKDSWCVTPNYKGLEDIKIEVQVRTVLMHSWAEIEHKLGYKSKNQIPKTLQRQLYLMSAKLEDADLQFQEIKTKADNYREKTLEESKQKGRFVSKDLNLDTLKVLLSYYFPEDKSNSDMESQLLTDIMLSKINLEEIVDIAEKTVKIKDDITKELFGKDNKLSTTSSNLLAYGLEIFNDGFLRSAPAGKLRRKIINKIKKNHI